MQSLLKRIQQVKPVYRVDDHVESWRKNAELTEMISSYPELPKPRLRTEKVLYLNTLVFLMIFIHCYSLKQGHQQEKE